MDYEFEWDEAKNHANIIKHKIDFADAAQVFFDERRIERLDIRNYGEDRYQVIGMSNGRVLFVVYTERHENRIRIISARKASKQERVAYEHSFY